MVYLLNPKAGINKPYFRQKQNNLLNMSIDNLPSHKLKLTIALTLTSTFGVLALTACSPAQREIVNDIVQTTVINNGVTQLNTNHAPIINSSEIPKSTNTLECGSIKPNQVVKIKGHTALSQGCDLTGKSVQFVLDKSNTSLDCRGARLSQAVASNASAITIKLNKNAAISNITVANCHVTGYGHAMNIRQKTNPNKRYLSGMTSLAQNKALAPHDIRVINLSSNGTTASGIFVGDHVHNAHFSNLLIRGAKTVGLYLEFGTQNNVIENSVFVDNGFRPFKPNREGIAVDSSANNIIRNNQFIHNGAGGVLLYRNCFEHANDSSRSNHFRRTQSSQNNIITGNTFLNEPVGVWVASRQSRNLIGFACGAYKMAETATARYHLDSAKNNQIIGNKFIEVTKSVIVEDDGTLIQGNDFSKAGGLPVSVGATIREQTQYGAVVDTVIEGNTFGEGKPVGQQINISQASLPSTKIVH